MLAEQLS